MMGDSLDWNSLRMKAVPTSSGKLFQKTITMGVKQKFSIVIPTGGYWTSQYIRQLTASECGNSSGGLAFSVYSNKSMVKFVKSGQSGLCV